MSAKTPSKIIFEAESGLGDSIEYIPALYVLRFMYPQAEIVVATCSFGLDLFAQLPFVDRVFDTKHTPKGLQAAINSFSTTEQSPVSADLAITVERNSRIINAVLATKVQKVVTFSYLKALFIPRLHFTSYIKRNELHEIWHYQHLVRSCAPKLYDKAFLQVDFSQARAQYDQESAYYVRDFLQQSQVAKYKHLIVLNPACSTAEQKGFNLKHEDYFMLADHLATLFPQCLFVLSSHQQEPYAEFTSSNSNLKIFTNIGSILRLIALVDQASLVIAPSTGTAHVADNLGVDVCALYPHYDDKRWSADGFNQLLAKQAQKQGKTLPQTEVHNHFTCLYLPDGWQNNYDHYLHDFEQLCAKVITSTILKQPSKLLQSMKGTA